MLPRNFIQLGAGLLALALAVGCGRSGPKSGGPSTPPPPTTTNLLDCTGTLHPVNIFIRRVKSDEIVEQVCVQPGAQVESGALLALLSCPDLQTEWLTLRREAGQIELNRRKKTVDESRLAELNKRLAVEESLRAKVAGYDPEVQARPLLDEKTRVEEEIQTLTLEIALGTQALQQGDAEQTIEARTARLAMRLTNLTVRAPFAGTVVRAEPSPEVANGVLVELHDRSRFNVHGVLWQNQLAFVQKGSRVIVTPDFMPGQSWTGMVTSIGFVPVAGSTEAFPRYPVVVSLDEGIDNAPLRDGMTAFMRIQRAGADSQSP